METGLQTVNQQRKLSEWAERVSACRSSGLTVCGKTGSAESSRNGRDVTHGLFIGYIADDALPFAVCVVVEDIPDGEGGGSTAAPIAGDIFTYLRDHADLVTN